MLPVSAIGKQTKGDREKAQVSFAKSQLILFQSRKKWGALYSLATVAGLFCMPGVLDGMWSETDILTFIQKTVPLPAISLLVAVGMYILNDLVDADLDRANGKKRPIPSGMVSKRQAWSFIMITNGVAMALALASFNVATLIIIVPMLAIGIMYSAPKVALMNRFIVKTVSISLFYVLCALLGITSGYGMDLALKNPTMPIHAMTMLGIMIFISSTLNDLGDVEGDRAAGRRTIPIVLGGKNTLKVMKGLAASMAVVSWALYATVPGMGIFTTITTSAFAFLVISRLSKMQKGLESANMEYMRKQHKKLFPLHMVLQANVGVGAMLFM